MSWFVGVRCVSPQPTALLGVEVSKRKAQPADTRLHRRLQQLDQLDPNEKRQALQLLDAFIERGKLKKKAADG